MNALRRHLDLPADSRASSPPSRSRASPPRIARAPADSSGPKPPPSSLAARSTTPLDAPRSTGITARITFTNNLFPSGSLPGTGSPLADRRQRPPVAGRRRPLAARAAVRRRRRADRLATASTLPCLRRVLQHRLPAALPGRQAGSRPRHQRQAGAPLGATIRHGARRSSRSADALRRQPGDDRRPPDLHRADRAEGRRRPARRRRAGLGRRQRRAAARGRLRPGQQRRRCSSSRPPTSPTAPIAGGDLDVTPPPARKVDSSSTRAAATRRHDRASPTPSTASAAVQRRAAFPLSAPDALAGLPRQDVRLVTLGDQQRPRCVPTARASARSSCSSASGRDRRAAGEPRWPRCPQVNDRRRTGHELATALGTVADASSAAASATRRRLGAAGRGRGRGAGALDERRGRSRPAAWSSATARSRRSTTST